MNFGLITSYVIAGIILLSILTMNMSLSNNSNELALTQINRTKAANISELISSDIQKIGYNRTTTTSPILTVAEHDKIQFRSNIDDSDDQSVEIVTWEFTNTAVNNTGNPDDYILKRTVHDASSGALQSETDISLGVTKFNIKYFDEYGAPISDSLSTPITGATLGDIRQLYISLRVESGEQLFTGPGGSGRYIPAVWEKRFSPPNLEF